MASNDLDDAQMLSMLLAATKETSDHDQSRFGTQQDMLSEPGTLFDSTLVSSPTATTSDADTATADPPTESITNTSKPFENEAQPQEAFDT